MKRFYLLPVITLSIMTFALAGCDQPADQSATMAPADPMAAPTAPAPTEATPAPQEIQGGVMIQNAYAFETAAGSTTGAVFAVFHNSSSTEDSLIGATTDVAEKVELHESTIDSIGLMKMAMVDKIVVPAQGKVELTPNGFHAMLINLKSPLTMGQTFNITFDFVSGAKIEVPVTISAAGAPAAQPMSHDHGAMGHEGMAAPADATMAAPADATMAAPAMPEVDAAVDAVVEEIAPAPEIIPMAPTPAAPMPVVPVAPAPATPDAPAGQ